MESLSDIKNDKLLHISFNQDHSCFSIGSEQGFRIYDLNPFKTIFERSNKYIYYYLIQNLIKV